MKTRVQIDSAIAPGGGELALFRHDGDYAITIDGEALMDSRQHESELELARLGCAHLMARKAPCVLIGGLGMGYTLRQALELLPADARVEVGELSSVIVDWNRRFFAALNNAPLDDARVTLVSGDVAERISRSRARFDAILLDVDNGPHALSDPRNHRLYSPAGLLTCRQALRSQGCLAVWSAAPSPRFEHLLTDSGFKVRRFRVAAHRGSKSRSRVVWVASPNRDCLPPGGRPPALRR